MLGVVIISTYSISTDFFSHSFGINCPIKAIINSLITFDFFVPCYNILQGYPSLTDTFHVNDLDKK